MDKQYSVKFFTSFIEAMQKLCREYLDFEQGVELSGYLAVEIDNFKKERYVLSELVQSTGNVISESYCTKAFKTLRKEPQRVSNVHGSENIAPRDHMNRTGRSHSEEVTIILRDSPETVSRHSNFPLHTTPHKSSSNSQRHAFHHNPRAHTFSRHKDSAAVSVSNPFEMSPSSRGQQHQQPFEIQPRCSESLQVLPNLSPKTPQKRNIGDVDSAHLSPIPKKDKIDHIGSGIESLLAATDNVNDTHADMDSMQNIYSTSATATTTTSVSDSLHTTIDCSSQPASDENLRLPIGMDIKREKDDDSSFMIIENPSDPTVKLLEAEGMFGGERESSQTLGLDTSTSFSADSQSADHGDFKDSGSLGDMAGTSWDSSNQRTKSNAERARLYRQRRKTNIEKYEAYKRREQLRFQQRKKDGRIKLINSLSEAEKRRRREIWRKTKRLSREKKQEHQRRSKRNETSSLPQLPISSEIIQIKEEADPDIVWEIGLE